ncbi:MAG: 50S ribosomal protein L23 [Candidatus Magasanikbacteria bacterium GW2011_GWC2_34_16]|uniref:Large ribosomal subunit protein uL23 n=2 Tax=Candidatus Magasanikiibacteriota TaxID=1752731 RepID=A0A0G0JQW1_9BACT|nr:MAG: 50S ribosomal protein L23 [Candidatus Magasanikbacteria bacterium GW2011_GWC2_34_16]KKQ39284.1 MAG: 50S ribosomal protein L23 [Candidatus Magasanikbacteria bacterium GW2011_GWA2_37_8]
MTGLLDRWSKRKQQEQLNKPVEKAKAEDKAVAKASGTKKAEKTEAKVVKVAGKISDMANKVLVRPLITEKSAVMQSNNKYGFVVGRSATKTQIKKAIKEAYDVMPTSVNTINMDGKRVRFGRSNGRRSDFKKALITLPAGKTITIHEGV